MSLSLPSSSRAAPILSPDTATAELGSPRLRPPASTDCTLSRPSTAHVAAPEYRKYAQLVDKTLASFDSVSDWADFITFLAKLLKALTLYPNYTTIPHTLIVAKRLAQCLNPALPTGVHQRTLDVYVHILTVIGEDALVRDLPAWSSGLFPFFQYAATSVKPIVLGIYEKFYLPLQARLRPATKSFILALLPGLEEETGDFFERVAALMDRVSGTVSPEFFFQNMWLVLVTAPNSRIPALNYLQRRLPKMESGDRQDVGLMVRGFAAALEDPQILVQRGVLELLTTTLKLDSIGFKSTRRTDQILLMRAVTGVVLRRDLSLSRRLYTWLLGSSESLEEQSAHLKEHGLELLHSALNAEMSSLTPSTPDRQRPFKIFISLLDKWEIGAPLTEVLVLDAFTAMERLLRPNDDHDELLMTGNMLFEIIDPFLMWKGIYRAVQRTLSRDESSKGTKAIELARFIVRKFRLHEEEVQKLHAPFVAFAILDLVEETALSGTPPAPAILTSALHLASELLAEIAPRFFESDSSLDVDSAIPGFCSDLAEALYGADDMKTALIPELEGRELLAAGFATVLRLARGCITRRSRQDSDRTLLVEALGLLQPLSLASTYSDELLPIAWDSSAWMAGFIAFLVQDPAGVASFGLHAEVIRSILTLAGTKTLRPAVTRNERSVVQALTDKLLDYLQPVYAPCFVESVQLFWGVQELSSCRHVESMISERLTSPDTLVRLSTFEAFGNIWRFTEDAQLPGAVLRSPMLLVLDSLKAEDLGTRRAGEAWMRCSLKNYLRVVDPLLFTLLDPSIQYHSEKVLVAGLELPMLQYRNTFDQACVYHILDDLFSLTRFAGLGLIRVAKGSMLMHTLDPTLRDRVRASALEGQTYLDGMVTILVRFLRADPVPELVESMGPLNHHIHSTIAELLQVIISRGELDMVHLQAIETALSSRLYLCIHRAELDLQNKLLHVLHSVVHAIFALRKQEKGGPDLSGQARDLDNLVHPIGISRDAFFVKVLSDAISLQRNSAVVHHWIDFLLMTISQFRRSLHSVLLPLIDSLVTRLRIVVTELKTTYLTTPSRYLAHPLASEATDAEFTVLMNALERLLLIAISEVKIIGTDATPASPEQKTMSEGPSLFGYIAGAMASAEVEPSGLSESAKTRQLAFTRVRDTVNLLLYSWDVSSSLDSSALPDEGNSHGYISSRTKVRTRKAFERIFKMVPSEALEGIVLYWDRQRALGATEANVRLFLMLDILTPSAQTVATMLCERLALRSSSSARANAPVPLAPSDDVTFAFLETYIDRMEGSSAVLVWSVLLAFVRELLSNNSTAKPHIFAGLRCFTSLSEKVSQTSALEDRRMRRDLQETFIRLTDASVVLAGRAVEVAGWSRRPMVEVTTNGEGESVVAVSEKKSETTVEMEEERRTPPVSTSQAHDITDFLAQRVLPDLRRFLIDADKTATVCTNIVYYVVAPAFRTRSRAYEIEPAVFELLIEMAKNPAAIKAWRTQVADAFADNRFFNAPSSVHASWKPLIQTLMASDKERLVELTARISSVSSANIFTNRELESLSRALSLRRLTYTIFTGEKNRFLTQLPTIQEKLVDLLRSSVGDLVHAEVYLCLRVLLCRVGNQHLTGLWPVILTELLRLFESLVDHAVPDGSDLLQLVLAACKFLDLTLVLQTEEFQIHQWMFVTDTVDAMYPPDGWRPQAIMDRLGEILVDPHQLHEPAHPTPLALPSSLGVVPRRPLLTIRRIDTIAALEPFFSTVSLSAYESVYNSGGTVDWEAVERGLEGDLFDGPSE